MKKTVLRMHPGMETRKTKDGQTIEVRDMGYIVRQALAIRKHLSKGELVRLEARNDMAKACMVDTLVYLNQQVTTEGKELHVSFTQKPVYGRDGKHVFMKTIVDISL